MTDFHPCEIQPAEVVQNRPGLTSIAYRVADHGGFLDAMKLALRRQPPLRDLNTSIHDPSIALLDAWAVTLDVLSFYQERIANEHYLRTAAERGSVLQLARQIGYELRPGVAASTFLAFTVEPVSATGAPNTAEITIGTQAQSVPGQDELPQIFETVEEIHAEAAWNELRAQTTVAHPLAGSEVLYLKGVTTNLSLGDGLLLLGDDRRNSETSTRVVFRRVNSIDVDRDFEVTTVGLDSPLGAADTIPVANLTVHALRTKASHFGYNAPDWKVLSDEIQGHYTATTPTAGRVRGSGPTPVLAPGIGVAIESGGTVDEWPDFDILSITGDEKNLVLDRLYKEIVPGSWIVVVSPTGEAVYRVDEVIEDALAKFALAGKATRLVLWGQSLAAFKNDVREVVIHGESEEIELAERPLNGEADVVAGNTISLQEPVMGLEAGRMLAVSGTTKATGDEAGEEVVEIVELKDYDEAAGILTLVSDLAHDYEPNTVRINANVARATHGESRTETLGNGRGAESFQSFTLANAPVTHVSAANVSGHESTLVLRVDGIEWKEAGSLYGQAAEATLYEARQGDDGKTTVRFGDGKTGARLPTGNDNVAAEYRVGAGLDGHVEARQIKLLTKKPLGVKSVENPLAPSGADDREALADARENAPLTVLTLDRVVSLRDVEFFARAFPGIAKAQVTRLWDGEKRFVHLTVAGTDGDAVDEESDTYKNLRDALRAAGHGAEEIRIGSYESVTFSLGASLTIDEAYVAEDVYEAATAALLDAFSFDSRSLGQWVTGGEVMAVLQAVDGVVAVDLNTLNGLDALAKPRIPSLLARYVGTDRNSSPAQLVTIDSEGVDLEEPAS